MQQSVLVGLQHGDEGKGKISKILGELNDYDCYIRFNGGPNAGHTIYHNDKKIVLHQLPCGIINNKEILISTDCVIDISKLIDEIKLLENIGFTNIKKLIHISKFCHVITTENIEKDKHNNKIGTTCSGIGPTYSNKMMRTGKRIEKSKYYKLVEPFNFLQKFNNVFFEGAQGFELDIDYGDYPYVTSSSCISHAIFKNGGNMNVKCVIYGICKIYDTYVGTKNFGDDTDQDLKRLQVIGDEYGATTNRKRKCNWLNMKKLLYACKINRVNCVYMNKCDIIERLGVYKLYDLGDRLFTFVTYDNMIGYIETILKRYNYNIIFSGSKNSL